MKLDHTFYNTPIAHRGLHNLAEGFPENSLEAAISQGFAIEIDLQLSHDGIPVVFHDYKLDRVTDEVGLISDRSAAELEKYYFAG